MLIDGVSRRTGRRTFVLLLSAVVVLSFALAVGHVHRDATPASHIDCQQCQLLASATPPAAIVPPPLPVLAADVCLAEPRAPRSARASIFCIRGPPAV